MEKKQKKKGVLKRLYDITEQKNRKLVLSCLLTALGTVLTAVPYVGIFNIAKEVLLSSLGQIAIDYAMISKWVIITIGSIILSAICIIIGGTMVHSVAYSLLYKLRIKIMDRISKLHLGFYNQNTSGSIQKIMDENVEKIEEFISHILPNLVSAFTLLIVLSIYMFSLNVLLTITVFVSIILAFIIQFIVFGGQKGKDTLVKINALSTDMNSGFAEYVNGMEEIKMFGKSSQITNRLSQSIHNYGEFAIKFLKKVSPFFEGYKAITTSLPAFILPVAVMMLMGSPNNYQLMLATLMFLMVTPALYTPILELVELGSNMRDIAVRLDEIERIFSYEVMEEQFESKALENYEVVFDNVSFAYKDSENENKVLNNVSFTAHNNQVTALVGMSGSGKSTIAQLIPRFWDVEEGTIRIGGINIREMPVDQLMDIVSFVFQDTYIFADTILHNITMNKEMDMSKVEAVAKKARCHDFIMALPNGYDTLVGDGGHKLSGGEAQRIAIARALLKNAPIVVLDEAMAYSDTENEYLIGMALEELLRDKTVITIAHRLQTIKNADQILVLQKGSIIEQGTYNELLQDKTVFKYLWDIQHTTNNWELIGGR